MIERIFRSKEYIEGRPKIAAIIAGFQGKIGQFEQARSDLQKAGYDVVIYDYPDGVLTDGSIKKPLELGYQITEHFNNIADSYQTRLYSGVSMGGAFGIDMQRNSKIEVEPGIYAGTLGNLSWGIWHQPAFLPIKRAYRRNGYKEEDLRTAWAPFYEPTNASFVVVLGSRDYFVRYKPTTQMYENWEDATIKILTKNMGHARIINWFTYHVPEMLEVSRAIASNKAQ